MGLMYTTCTLWKTLVIVKPLSLLNFLFLEKTGVWSVLDLENSSRGHNKHGTEKKIVIFDIKDQLLEHRSAVK